MNPEHVALSIDCKAWKSEEAFHSIDFLKIRWNDEENGERREQRIF